MSVNIIKEADFTIAEVTGDIDGKTAPVAQAQIVPLAGEDCKLMLDMSGVSYMSSAGLRMLLVLRRQVPSSGRLVLVGLSESLKDTMSVTGFLDFFTVSDTREEGVAALNS